MFRFTIRDLLWLTVVVGLAIAHWKDRSELSRSAAKLSETQNTLGVVAERRKWAEDGRDELSSLLTKYGWSSVRDPSGNLDLVPQWSSVSAKYREYKEAEKAAEATNSN